MSIILFDELLQKDDNYYIYDIVCKKENLPKQINNYFVTYCSICKMNILGSNPINSILDHVNSNLHYSNFFGISIFYSRCVLCHGDENIHIICNHNNTKLHKKKLNVIIKMMKTYLYPDLINLIISYLPYVNMKDASLELKMRAYRLCE